MSTRLSDTIFWFSAICCVVAQAAILRSVIVAPLFAAQPSGGSMRRRTIDIVWAILPGLALVAVFVLTWQMMHGGHAATGSPSAMR